MGEDPCELVRSIKCVPSPVDCLCEIFVQLAHRCTEWQTFPGLSDCNKNDFVTPSLMR